LFLKVLKFKLINSQINKSRFILKFVKFMQIKLESF
jgi:hypothetical protein